VEQTAFRLDGVLRPEAGHENLPLIFVEVQFQRRTNFYARWLASIFLYLFRHPGIARSWRAVVVFPDGATDNGALAPYEPLLDWGCCTASTWPTCSTTRRRVSVPDWLA
jgi:predicted transposase YdaD